MESVVLVKPTNERVNEKIVWDVTIDDKDKSIVYGKRILMIDKQMENGANFVTELFWEMEGIFQSIQDESAWSEVKSIIIEATKPGSEYLNKLIFNKPLNEYRTNIDAKGRPLAIKLQRIDEMKKMYLDNMESDVVPNLEDTLSFDELNFNDPMVDLNTNIPTDPIRKMVMPSLEPVPNFNNQAINNPIEATEQSLPIMPDLNANSMPIVVTEQSLPIMPDLNANSMPIVDIPTPIMTDPLEAEMPVTQAMNEPLVSDDSFADMFERVDENEYQNILNGLQGVNVTPIPDPTQMNEFTSLENEVMPSFEPSVNNAPIIDLPAVNVQTPAVDLPIIQGMDVRTDPVIDIPTPVTDFVTPIDVPKSNMMQNQFVEAPVQQMNNSADLRTSELEEELKRHENAIKEILQKYNEL